jgi:ABC-type hemin transport system, periplasmic component
MHPLRLLAALVIGHWALVISASAAQPERIVSLGGAITETVFALGAGDQIVARDTSSVFPAAVHRLPDVGYFRTIGAEGVLAQKPTLILAAQGTGPAPQVEILKNSGVTFVHLDARYSAETLLANIARLGEVLHRETEAAALAGKLRAQLDAVKKNNEASSARPVRAVFLMSMDEAATQAAYDGTAADALIELAGGENPLTGLVGYKPLNAEALLALDPDVIFYGVNPRSPHREPPAWLRATRAGRADRIHALDLGYHLSFGPRLGDAVAEVAALLRPAAPALASARSAP